MKKLLFIAVSFVILISGCQKNDGPDPPINPEQVNIIINTVLPEGLTVSGLEICFACKGVFNIPIQPGIDTVVFNKNEAKELLGKEATVSLFALDPKLDGLACQLEELPELNFVVKVVNNLSWTLEAVPESASVIFITNFVLPDVLSYEQLRVIILTPENEELPYYVREGVDTISVSGQVAFGLLNNTIQIAGDILGENINGNTNCFPYCQNHEYGYAFVTVEPVNNVEWVFVLPE